MFSLLKITNLAKAQAISRACNYMLAPENKCADVSLWDCKDIYIGQHKTDQLTSTKMSLPRGFKFLPVTAGLTSALIVIPLAISIFNWKPYFMFAWDPFITKWNQFWRLPILQLQFQNQSEVTISVVITILKLKGLERVFGSLKTLKVLILLYFYNFVLMTILSFALYRSIGWDLFMPSGPFGIIFGLYYPYMKYIPDVYVAEFDFGDFASPGASGKSLNISISDRFSCQILYLLLFFSEGVPSMVLCTVGYFIGYLYFHDLVPITDTALGYFDPLYYKLTHQKEYESSVGNSNNNSVPTNTANEAADHESQAIDLADEDANGTSREDTPVRTFGQQMLDSFRR